MSTACLGWECGKRGTCRFYVPNAIQPVNVEQRICRPYTTEDYEAVVVIRPAGTWKTNQRSQATWMSLIVEPA